MGRNVLIGLSVLNWDASAANFRVESFNALNHTNYWGVEGDMTSSRFGQVTTITDLRTQQVMLRLSF